MERVQEARAGHAKAVMSAQSLLFWMSARGQGSWAQFKAAVEELHLNASESNEPDAPDEDVASRNSLPLYRTLQLNLQRLGHAEFFSEAAGSDWRVAPPTLATTEHQRGWAGVLTGARTGALLQRVATASAQFEIDVSALAGCPDKTILISADLEALRNSAENTGLLFQHRAPQAILASIPRIDDLSIRRPAQLPFGGEWKIERFSPSSLSWTSAVASDAKSASLGLFRFSRRHEKPVFLCSRGSAYSVANQVGKYLVLKGRRQRVLFYDSTSKILSVPASCRPPFLVERALVLCSGAPPAYEARSSMTGLLHYSNVSAQIARLVSALLTQELR